MSPRKGMMGKQDSGAHEWPGGDLTLDDVDDAPDDVSYALMVGLLAGSHIIDMTYMWELLAERGLRIYTTRREGP